MVVGGFGSRIRKARYAPHIERCLEEFVSEVPERKIEILQELSELVKAIRHIEKLKIS